MNVSSAVFACHSAACAPPPAGTGGSTGGAAGAARYHPDSVTVEPTGTGSWKVVDRSVKSEGVLYGWEKSWNDANARANVRRKVIRAAITRQANKAKAKAEDKDPLLALARHPRNAEALKDHGSPEALVKWLRKELSDAEATAWLEA